MLINEMRRLGRRRDAVDLPQARGSARSSASGPGAGWSGIGGYPPLMDGGCVTAPRLAFYGPKGEWDVENHGVAPDIEVEFDPHAWRAGPRSAAGEGGRRADGRPAPAPAADLCAAEVSELSPAATAVTADRWQYRRVKGEPKLEALGAEGWELVAIRGEEWLFKRPAPEPTERFTLEQRAAALGAPRRRRQRVGGCLTQRSRR